MTHWLSLHLSHGGDHLQRLEMAERLDLLVQGSRFVRSLHWLQPELMMLQRRESSAVSQHGVCVDVRSGLGVWHS